MYVRAIVEYKDVQLGRKLKLNETFEVDDERGQYLISLGYVKEKQTRKPKSYFNGGDETYGTENGSNSTEENSYSNKGW